MDNTMFEHDCRTCKFLGHFVQSNHCNGWTDFDLYFCPQRGFPTLIARFGSDGPDYMSGLEFGKPNRRCVDFVTGLEVPEIKRSSYPLIIAYQRAQEAGLL